MAKIVNKKKTENVLELITPDFSFIKDEITEEPISIISWTINLSNDPTSFDSMSIVVVGIPVVDESYVETGDEMIIPVQGKKPIRAGVRMISESLGSDGRLITSIELESLGRYLDTNFEQSISVKEKDFSKIILKIYEELGIEIEYDPSSDKLDWILKEFRVGANQSLLEYINGAINQNGQKLIRYWIDLFGVLHVYKLLTPTKPTITFDIMRDGYLINNISRNKVDDIKQKAKLKNLEFDDTDKSASKVIKVRNYTETLNAKGKYESSFTTGTKKRSDKPVNSTIGTLLKTKAVPNATKLTQEISVSLRGFHLILPQNQVIIKNSPIGNDTYVCKATTITQTQNGDIVTNTILENDN